MTAFDPKRTLASQWPRLALISSTRMLTGVLAETETMKMLLPLAMLYVGLRILIDPVIWSLKYGFIFDLSVVHYPLAGLLLSVGAVLLLEALGKGPFSKR